MTYLSEFGDYPPADMPAIPAHWVDSSWHNDICPSFYAIPEREGRPALRVWVDYADVENREFGPGERFSCVWDDQDEHCFWTDDWPEMLAYVAALEALDVRAVLQARGFEEIETGGGCKALRLVLDDGAEIVVTGADGCSLPTEADWMIGRYPDSDWQPDGAGLWPVSSEKREFGRALADAIGDNMPGALAAAFASELFEEIGRDDWAAMRAANVGQREGVCASHDYCDANMPMSRAFADVAGHEIDPQSDDDATLWGAAWDIALRHYLTDSHRQPPASPTGAPPPLPDDSGLGRYRCRCGRDDQIDILAHVYVRLTPDGTDADASGDGSHIWEADSPAVCRACGHSDNIETFRLIPA